MLMHTAGELEGSQRRVSSLERAALRAARSQLTDEIWMPHLCDASVTLRSDQLMVLAGVRVPREPALGGRGAGVTPGLAVLRQVGSLAGGGMWAAVGGSLLWDAREREVSSMRLALSARPSTHERIGLAFDHTGGLSGSVQTSRENLTARVYGTVDVNGKRANNRAGIEVVYDVAE